MARVHAAFNEFSMLLAPMSDKLTTIACAQSAL